MIKRFQEQISLELVIKPVFVLLLVGLLADMALGQTARVRGLVRRQGQPAAYIRVTLTPEGTKEPSSEAYTGRDGMYYFYVPHGVYILEVWQSRNGSVGKYRLNVNQESVDAAIIDLP